MEAVLKGYDGMEMEAPQGANCENMRPERRWMMQRLRMIADFVLVVAFGFAAPALLAPISRSGGAISLAVVTFVLSVVCLWDGMRMAARLHR
jgi:hypothetical protein